MGAAVVSGFPRSATVICPSMLLDRGIAVDHSTLFRWVQAYAAKLEQRVRRHLQPCTGSWRVDETYIKVKGVWTYLYRAVDSLGQTIDFWLSAQRDAAAAKRFVRKALAQPHTVNPRTITVDKNPANPRAMADMKRAGELWRFSRLRQCKYLNNIVEQDHRMIKRLVRPMLGFGSLRTARQTLAGYEVMAMIGKGQVYNTGGREMRAQAAFIAGALRASRLKVTAPSKTLVLIQRLQQNQPGGSSSPGSGGRSGTSEMITTIALFLVRPIQL